MKNTTNFMHPNVIRIIRSKDIEFIRPNDLAKILKLSKTTIWRMGKRKIHPLPPKRNISGNSTGWLSDEIEDWLRKTPPNDNIS